MNIKILKAGLAGVVLSVSGFANAALIDMGTTTLDDNTGLEWLDLTETKGMSNNDVRAEFVQGGSLEGYRYASLLEVEGFLTAAGGIGPHYLGSDRVNIPLGGWTTELLALWGTTNLSIYNNLSFVMFGDVVIDTWQEYIQTDPGDIRPNGLVCASYYYCDDRVDITGERTEIGLLQDFILAGYSTVRFGIDYYQRKTVDFSQSNYGSALVKSVDVSSPSTLAIFALGLMGLASRRFKNQS